MKYNPRSYQRLGTEFLLNTPRAALWAQPGLGKTSTTLTVIDMLRLMAEVDRSLVVVPKRVLDTEGWQREIAKWDHLAGLAIEPITGNAAQRRAKLMSPAPIHLINYELLPWLLEELVRCWPYDLVVLDESTKVKGYDSTWFKGNPRSKDDVSIGSTLQLPDGRKLMLDIHTKPVPLPGNTRVLANAVPSRVEPSIVSQTTYPVRRLIEPPPPKRIIFEPTAGLKHVSAQTARWINLTGTPMPNGVKDLFSQTHLLDQGARLGVNITRFREHYQSPHPHVKHLWIDQPGALGRAIGKLGDICLSIKAADYLDLPKQIPNPIDVALPESLVSDYKHLEDEFFLRLEAGVVEAANAAVLGNKLRQFTQGFLFTGKKDAWQELHQAKIDALLELRDEVGGPWLIAYHFDPDKTRLLKAIPGSVVFDGTRKQIEAFAAGKIRDLIIQPASAGHGVDGLQDGTDTIVFFGTDWSLENHDQVIARIGPVRQLQSGHPRPVFVHYITAQHTVDELVLERLVEKKSAQEILMNAMQRRKKK